MNLDTCEVKKEELRLEEVVGKWTSQLVISHTVTIPEEKPPARAIIDFVARPRINKVTVLPGKVVVDGIIDFTIIYEATEVTQTVHVFHAEVPFSQFVEIPGAEPGMTANVNVVVEHAVFSLTADGRDVTIRAVAALKVKLTQSIVIEVVTDVTGVVPAGYQRSDKGETVLARRDPEV